VSEIERVEIGVEMDRLSRPEKWHDPGFCARAADCSNSGRLKINNLNRCGRDLSHTTPMLHAETSFVAHVTLRVRNNQAHSSRFAPESVLTMTVGGSLLSFRRCSPASSGFRLWSADGSLGQIRQARHPQIRDVQSPLGLTGLRMALLTKGRRS
jgi:hypothetical protein